MVSPALINWGDPSRALFWMEIEMSPKAVNEGKEPLEARTPKFASVPGRVQ
jgi:hypothetical protein